MLNEMKCTETHLNGMEWNEIMNESNCSEDEEEEEEEEEQENSGPKKEE
jgi:hypothetical protein